MSLKWGTGADLMVPDLSANAAFAQLGWYGLPSDPALSQMTVVAGGRFGYGNMIGMHNSSSSGGNVVQGSYLLKHGVTLPGQWRQGAAMFVPTNEAYQKPFIAVARTGDALITACLWTFGRVQLWLGRPHDVGAVLLATSNPGVYYNDIWNYVELGGLLINNGTGFATVRINTVEVIAVVATVTNASNVPANSYMIGYGEATGLGGDNTGTFWDDLYILDTAGADNNDWLGNIRVQGLIPNAAGASTMWSVFGAMTNWEGAGNTLIDDSKYVFTPNIGDYDLYEIDPVINTPQVFGVQVTGFYRQDDATQRSVANVILSGATQDEGAEFFTPQGTGLAGGYAAATDMWEEDPDTDDPWLYPDVNNLQIGPKVRS